MQTKTSRQLNDKLNEMVEHALDFDQTINREKTTEHAEHKLNLIAVTRTKEHFLS